jgi:hypothetical protein
VGGGGGGAVLNSCSDGIGEGMDMLVSSPASPHECEVIAARVVASAVLIRWVEGLGFRVWDLGW